MHNTILHFNVKKKKDSAELINQINPVIDLNLLLFSNNQQSANSHEVVNCK